MSDALVLQKILYGHFWYSVYCMNKEREKNVSYVRLHMVTWHFAVMIKKIVRKLFVSVSISCAHVSHKSYKIGESNVKAYDFYSVVYTIFTEWNDFFYCSGCTFFLSHDINSVKQQICGILMRQREVPGVKWKYLWMLYKRWYRSWYLIEWNVSNSIHIVLTHCKYLLNLN